MTRREAWLELADAWKNPCTLAGFRTIVYFNGMAVSGLCICIDMLAEGSRLSDDDAVAMLQAIERVPARPRPESDTLFKWPRTPAGAKARAAFCRAQAEKA